MDICLHCDMLQTKPYIIYVVKRRESRTGLGERVKWRKCERVRNRYHHFEKPHAPFSCLVMEWSPDIFFSAMEPQSNEEVFFNIKVYQSEVIWKKNKKTTTNNRPINNNNTPCNWCPNNHWCNNNWAFIMKIFSFK